MTRVIVGISRFLAVLSALALVTMMIAIAADVIIRNTTGSSLPGMLEVAETSLVVAVFFGVAWAGVTGEHVAVTLLTDRLGERWVRPIDIGVWALATVFLAWLTYGLASKAISSTAQLEERFGIVRWPIYPMRWVIVVGVAIFVLVAILNLVRSIQGHKPLGKRSEVEGAVADDSAEGAS